MRPLSATLRYACLPFSSVSISSHHISVLAYHRVSGMTDSDFDLLPEQFDEQIDYLKQNTHVVGPSVLGKGLDFRWTESTPATILTFDDAYIDFYDTVFPRLCSSDLVATLFIPAGCIEEPARGREAFSAPLCTWSQLREMIKSGHVIPASHGYSHRSCFHLSPAQQEYDLEMSRQLIEDRLDSPVRDFAWPFGHWNDRALEVARRFYPRVWGFQGGVIDSDLSAGAVLPRIPIRKQDSLDWFLRKLSGSAALEDRVRSQLANLRAKAGL